MLCSIYKSTKKPGCYLYIEKRNDFSRVPEALLAQFGKPVFLMLFNLNSDKLLHNADKKEVGDKLASQGFYLQIPAQDDGLFNSLSEIK